MLLYGAGEHTRQLIEAVDFSNVEIEGIVDKYHCGNKHFLGYPIFSPSDIPVINPDMVLISSQIYEEEIYQEICYLQDQFQITIQKIYDDRFIFLSQERLLETFKEVQASLNEQTGKRTIIYVTYPPNLNFVRQSIALRKNNFYTIFLSFDQTIDPASLSPYFDQIHICTFYEIMNIILNLRPYLFHVSNSTANTHYLPTIIKLFSSAPVICEFYDIRSLFLPYEDDVAYRGKEITDMVHATELFSFENMDGVIYKNSPEIKEILGTKYNMKKTAMMEFQSYPTSSYFAYPLFHQRKKDKIKLVYAGVIAPSSEPNQLFGDIQIISFCRTLLDQSLELHVYTRPYYNDKAQCADYDKLAENDENFYFHSGILPDKLTNEISHCDFGMLIFHFPPTLRVQNEHFQTSMSTKLFTYLEAGLPLLVSEELHYMASLIKSWGLEIVFKQEELKNIKDVIQKYDYAQLRKNVLEYRNRFSMENMIHTLIDFYENVCCE